MDQLKFAQNFNRRLFLRQTGLGLGATAMSTLLPGSIFASNSGEGLPGLPHHAPTAKRVIYLFQSGGVSQFETLDYKPELHKMQKTELPDSVRMGQRLTGMTAFQSSFPVAASIFKFDQYGQNGTWVSEIMPHTANIVDDLCIVRTVHTEAINHDPAITFAQTGSQLAGRPSMGAWVAYGLGSMNRDLPTFVALTSRGSGKANDQPLYDRLWGSGFLPSRFQGVKLRSGNEPVLYLKTPEGISKDTRRRMLNDIAALNQVAYQENSDPEVLTRIEQAELAFRMQAAVPDMTDISDEPQHILDMYGPDVHRPGSYARNCLLARRMAERDVRFIQLYHMGWDHHNDLPDALSKQSKDTDQASAALIQDLKQRDLLKDTLVIWAGEFGRTVYSQGALTDTNYGRDHHPRCSSMYMAGGGVKAGLVYGETCDFSYNVVSNPVNLHDLNATVLHTLGINNGLLSYKHQGLDMKLTGVEEQKPVMDLLA